MTTTAVLTSAGHGVITNRIKAGGTEPLNIHWGIGTGTAAVPDTALIIPSTESRVAGTSTQQTTNSNNPNDTYQVVGTITASGSRTITEFGQFDTATAAPVTSLAATLSTTNGTTITVASSSGFPGSGTNYQIQCDSEVMYVTAGQGTSTWTVTRGYNGSTAATHASAETVVGGVGCSGGNCFIHATFTGISLSTNDSITFTSALQFT